MNQMGQCLLEEGGWRIGSRRMKEFNVALLEKWCWRLTKEIDRLWYSVLAARYREVGGRIV